MFRDIAQAQTGEMPCIQHRHSGAVIAICYLGPKGKALASHFTNWGLAEGDNYFQGCHSLFFLPGAVSRRFLSPAHVKFFREGLCVMARIRRAMGAMDRALASLFSYRR